MQVVVLAADVATWVQVVPPSVEASILKPVSLFETSVQLTRTEVLERTVALTPLGGVAVQVVAEALAGLEMAAVL